MSIDKRNLDESKANDNKDCDQNDNNIMQILVASDINLGYEQTVKRGNE